MMDLVESGKLQLSNVRFFVLDEADRLLDTGNLPTIMKMYGAFPKATAGPSRLQVRPPCILIKMQTWFIPSCRCGPLTHSES